MNDENEKRIARIIHVSRDYMTVVINQGSEDGIRMGKRFLVYGLGPNLKDPETQELLGQLEIVRGRGEIVHIQNRISTLRSIEKRRLSKRRIIKETPISSIVGPRTIEETGPDEYDEIPFEEPEYGDFAKPI